MLCKVGVTLEKNDQVRTDLYQVSAARAVPFANLKLKNPFCLVDLSP